ncbi:hypothetical protein [Candidatus Formimonas warabiya]|uniref:Uncharacterized protein n=1 Tax=Formimonas warabiya TaxID=1761012 RepID=A0A3G1KWT7_FORW1|nr:hypothetical protein [Candidatus Formimonas warabiya]ATW26912.1 hypothetical protein DCMF_21030 [Candidatus Formimonas warabiya]
MDHWDGLLHSHKGTLTVVGMAKNVGKTVTLNSLIDFFSRRGWTVGVTSVGRDGERYDALTQLRKPAITLQPGTFLATADLVLGNQKPVQLLRYTGMRTPMGEVALFQVKETADVVVAGPSKNHELRKVVELFLADLKVRCVLIDGAFDRQSAVDPAVSGKVILASGATLSRNMEEVIALTKCRVEQLTLAPCPAPLKKMIENSGARILLFDGENIREVSLPTALLRKTAWREIFREQPSDLFIKGAVGNELAEALLENRGPCRVIVPDGSKVFIDAFLWKRLAAQEIFFQALHPICLLAVTINPTYPGGKGYDPDELLEKMGSALHPLPVLDVMQGKKYQREFR